MQPGPRKGPKPFRGSHWKVERFRRFWNRESNEVTELHQFGRLRVLAGQTVQGIMHGQDVGRFRLGRGKLRVQLLSPAIPSAFAAPAAS